ncbi:hypothetical protein [Paenibacillus endoradicis]|uniref:hypothetical protein n=1 Tax=Paenibacillus endoradicis TaxID=2972487 RepID=UPI0021597A30|nr:hypothetical protein [Paenibacillus endoradicis]MCR8659434.1 hypothetical protein [Paenibacillus endoradicis]
MKRSIIIISLVLLILLVGCSKQSNLNHSTQEYLTENSSRERSLAQKIAWENLSEEEVKSILPWTHATIGKVENSKIPHHIRSNNPSNVYKVTYATVKDELLGPIGIYVDMDASEIVGYDLRH